MKYIYSIIFFFMFSGLCFADIVIVANPSVKETTLTRQEVNDIFLGKKRYWKDNSRIRVAQLGEGKIRHDFLEKYLKKTPAQYRIHIQKIVFTGQGKNQMRFQSAGKIVDYVSKTPGAIGYVDSHTLINDLVSLAVVD